MRLRGVHLLLATAASVGAMLVLAGPAAASNLHCGQTLTSSTTLIGNLDCTGFGGTAIKIGADNVTFNLNGFSIKGDDGYDVIRNFNCPGGVCTSHTGTLIKNGTLYVVGDDIAVGNDNGGGDHLTLDVVKIVGDGNVDSAGIVSTDSTGLTVLDGVISGVRDAIVLEGETGALIKHNTITPVDYQTHRCAGVYEDHGTTNMIYGNAFSPDAVNGDDQTCHALWTTYSAGTQFTLNTVTDMLDGVESHRYSAGLTITENVMDGNVNGIDLREYDSGDMIAGNFIKNSDAFGVTDVTSFNNTYNGNILTSNGSAANEASYYINPDGYGPVTMVNNYARLGYDAGFSICAAYSVSVSGPPYSSFVGNNAIANGTDGAPGFADGLCAFQQEDDVTTWASVGATWSANNAYANAYDGYIFVSPWREIITGNMAKLNGDDGFLFVGVYENAQPLAVTNNSATYNGGYGFSGWDDEGQGPPAYPVAGSGNTGGGTNGIGDCYLVAGCS